MNCDVKVFCELTCCVIRSRFAESENHLRCKLCSLLITHTSNKDLPVISLLLYRCILYSGINLIVNYEVMKAEISLTGGNIWRSHLALC